MRIPSEGLEIKNRQALNYMKWCQIGKNDRILAVIAVHKCTQSGTNDAKQSYLQASADRHSADQQRTREQAAASCLSVSSLTFQVHAFHNSRVKLDGSQSHPRRTLHDLDSGQNMATEPDHGLSGWGIFFLVAFVFIVIGGCAWIM